MNPAAGWTANAAMNQNKVRARVKYEYECAGQNWSVACQVITKKYNFNYTVKNMVIVRIDAFSANILGHRTIKCMVVFRTKLWAEGDQRFGSFSASPHQQRLLPIPNF